MLDFVPDHGIFESTSLSLLAVIPSPFANSHIRRGLHNGIVARKAGLKIPVATHTQSQPAQAHCNTHATHLLIHGDSAEPASCAVRFTPDMSSSNFNASPRYDRLSFIVCASRVIAVIAEFGFQRESVFDISAIALVASS